MKKLMLVSLIVSAVYTGMVHGQDITRLIDTPTAKVTEYGAYDLRFSFYTGGGILSRLSFGVLNRINVGFSWDLEEMVGSEDIDVNKPSLNLAIRFWDGNFIFPALALGYDGQGYFFDEITDEYLQREKGVYLVATQEAFLPKLELTFGGNIFDFSEDTVYGFAGINYLVSPIMIIGEVDNIHISEFNRINAGIRILITPEIGVDLAGRDLGAKHREAERILRINYRGTF
ncbi:MAG: hypothetical protein ABII23_08505 [bacterium]